MLKGGRAEQASAHRGRAGEDAAEALVRGMGWRVLDRNWRSGGLELDMVCEEGGLLVFVEVKTRAKGGMQSPAEALTRVKRERLVRAARHWLAEHCAWQRACRFDLVCVVAQGESYSTELMRNVIELGAGGHAVDRGHAPWQPW